MSHNKLKKQAPRLEDLTEEQLDSVAKELIDRLEDGMTLKEATGVSDETLEEIYTLAYGYYDQGKYTESVALFQFLAGASPANYKFVLGLAASYHQMGIYDQAVLGFYIAWTIESDNPIPAYYGMDCFLKLEHYEEAKEFAELTIEVSEKKPQYQELKERTGLTLKTINKKIKEASNV